MVGRSVRLLGDEKRAAGVGQEGGSVGFVFGVDLQQELGATVRETHGRLVLAEGQERPIAWAANIWRDPVIMDIASINERASPSESDVSTNSRARGSQA